MTASIGPGWTSNSLVGLNGINQNHRLSGTSTDSEAVSQVARADQIGKPTLVAVLTPVAIQSSVNCKNKIIL